MNHIFYSSIVVLFILHSNTTRYFKNTDVSKNAIMRNKIQIFLHACFHSELKKTPKFNQIAASNYIDLSLEKRAFAIRHNLLLYILINAVNVDDKDQSTSKTSTVTPSF